MPTVLIRKIGEPDPIALEEALADPTFPPWLVPLYRGGWSDYVMQSGNIARVRRVVALVKRIASERMLPLTAEPVDVIGQFLQEHGMLPFQLRDSTAGWCVTRLEEWGGSPVEAPVPLGAALPYVIKSRDLHHRPFAEGRAESREAAKRALHALRLLGLGTHLDVFHNDNLIETIAS